MELSAPCDDSLDFFELQPVKTFPWVNPMGVSIPMSDSIDTIAFQTAKIN